MTPTRVSLSVLLASLALVAGIAGYRHWRTAPDPFPAVATVDGAAITSRDLDVRLAQILPMASYHGNIEPSRLLGLKRAALDELILDELIFSEAVKLGQRADTSAVEEELQTARARFATDAEYEEALAANRMTASDFRRFTERKILVQEARASRARQPVTDAEAAAYYEANAQKFLRPEQVHLLELLIRADPADPASADAAGRKARALAARIRKGEAFGPLARDHSENEYRVKDGDLGFVHRGRLNTDLEAAAFAATPGEIGVVNSLLGSHVFKLIDRQPATQLTFDEAKPLIVERLARQRREQAERAWHEALLGAARISILDGALRETPPAELPAARLGSAMGGR